jgi:DNA polymerase III subunit epsilon
MRDAELKALTYLAVCVETTGVDPKTDRIIEIASVLHKSGKTDSVSSRLINPGIPIPAQSSAIHHIVSRDLKSAGDFNAAWADFIDDASESVPIVFWPMDWTRQMIGAEIRRHKTPEFEKTASLEKFCLKRMAMMIMPEESDYSLQSVRYALRAHDHLDRFERSTYISGLPKCHVLTAILDELIRLYGPCHTLGHLLDDLARPVKLKYMPFGKHRGEEIKTIPPDYISHMLSLPDLDADVRHSMEWAVPYRDHTEGIA